MPITELDPAKHSLLEGRSDYAELIKLYDALDELISQEDKKVGFDLFQIKNDKTQAKREVRRGLIDLIQSVFDIYSGGGGGGEKSPYSNQTIDRRLTRLHQQLQHWQDNERELWKNALDGRLKGTLEKIQGLTFSYQEQNQEDAGTIKAMSPDQLIKWALAKGKAGESLSDMETVPVFDDSSIALRVVKALWLTQRGLEIVQDPVTLSQAMKTMSELKAYLEKIQKGEKLTAAEAAQVNELLGGSVKATPQLLDYKSEELMISNHSAETLDAMRDMDAARLIRFLSKKESGWNIQFMCYSTHDQREYFEYIKNRLNVSQRAQVLRLCINEDGYNLLEDLAMPFPQGEKIAKECLDEMKSYLELLDVEFPEGFKSKGVLNFCADPANLDDKLFRQLFSSKFIAAFRESKRNQSKYDGFIRRGVAVHGMDTYAAGGGAAAATSVSELNPYKLFSLIDNDPTQFIAIMHQVPRDELVRFFSLKERYKASAYEQAKEISLLRKIELTRGYQVVDTRPEKEKLAKPGPLHVKGPIIENPVYNRTVEFIAQLPMSVKVELACMEQDETGFNLVEQVFTHDRWPALLNRFKLLFNVPLPSPPEISFSCYATIRNFFSKPENCDDTSFRRLFRTEFFMKYVIDAAEKTLIDRKYGHGQLSFKLYLAEDPFLIRAAALWGGDVKLIVTLYNLLAKLESHETDSGGRVAVQKVLVRNALHALISDLFTDCQADRGKMDQHKQLLSLFAWVCHNYFERENITKGQASRIKYYLEKLDEVVLPCSDSEELASVFVGFFKKHDFSWSEVYSKGWEADYAGDDPHINSYGCLAQFAYRAIIAMVDQCPGEIVEWVEKYSDDEGIIKALRSVAFDKVFLINNFNRFNRSEAPRKAYIFLQMVLLQPDIEKLKATGNKKEKIKNLKYMWTKMIEVACDNRGDVFATSISWWPLYIVCSDLKKFTPEAREGYNMIGGLGGELQRLGVRMQGIKYPTPTPTRGARSAQLTSTQYEPGDRREADWLDEVRARNDGGASVAGGADADSLGGGSLEDWERERQKRKEAAAAEAQKNIGARAAARKAWLESQEGRDPRLLAGKASGDKKGPAADTGRGGPAPGNSGESD